MSLKLSLKWTMKFEIVNYKFPIFWNTTNYVQKFWGGTPCTTGNSRFGIWFFTWPLLCRRCLFIRSLCNSRPNWFCSPAGHTCFLFLSFAHWRIFRQKIPTLVKCQIVSFQMMSMKYEVCSLKCNVCETFINKQWHLK